MAAGSEWKDDSDLKFQLESLVKKGYERSEILHVMQKDFPQYTWMYKNLRPSLTPF